MWRLRESFNYLLTYRQRLSDAETVAGKTIAATHKTVCAQLDEAYLATTRLQENKSAAAHVTVLYSHQLSLAGQVHLPKHTYDYYSDHLKTTVTVPRLSKELVS